MEVASPFAQKVLGPRFLCLPGISAKCGNNVLIPEPTDNLVRPFCLDLHTLVAMLSVNSVTI